MLDRADQPRVATCAAPSAIASASLAPLVKISSPSQP